MKTTMRLLAMLVLMVSLAIPAQAQTMQDSNYRTTGHIKSDGTVQDSNYRTIGHAGNTNKRWAAAFFFFFF